MFPLNLIFVSLLCVLVYFSLNFLYGPLLFLHLDVCLLFHVKEVFDCDLFRYFLRYLLLLFFFWDSCISNVDAFNVVLGV